MTSSRPDRATSGTWLSVGIRNVPLMQQTATRSLPETPVSGLPAGLAGMPPGPGLAAVLADVDLGTLTGAEVVTVLQAEYRQSAHQRSRVLAAAYETGMRRPLRTEFDRLESADEFSSDEVRAALGLTRSAATKLFDLAYQTMSRLPELHQAMAAGELDEPRARVLADWSADLRDAHARDICRELLPRVVPPATEDDPVALTTGQLIDEIKTLAVALDRTGPSAATRTPCKSALQERDVRGSANPDGTADITGRQLPVDRVAAACGRIDALARSAKSGGDPRRIAHLRAELFLGMTDGTYEGLTDAQILAHLAANQPPPPDEGADAAAQPAPDAKTGAEPAAAARTAGEADVSGLAIHGPSRAGVELRVRLSTLLGLDRYPAELSGWGPVHAELARDLAIELGPAQWRYALTDAEGRLIHAGLTPARPNAVRLRSAHSKAIVEIQVPAALLADLTGGELAARFTGDPAALAR